jgi:hypothetical protein
VFERKARNTLAHANNEKVRRHEMLDCFHTLGSTFLSEEELRKTNRYNILKLVIMKMIMSYLPEYTTGLEWLSFGMQHHVVWYYIPEDSHLHISVRTSNLT